MSGKWLLPIARTIYPTVVVMEVLVYKYSCGVFSGTFGSKFLFTKTVVTKLVLIYNVPSEIHILELLAVHGAMCFTTKGAMRRCFPVVGVCSVVVKIEQ